MSDESTLERVAEWSTSVHASRMERNQAIREAYAEGYSYRTIAEAAEMSHAAIKKIVDSA